MWKFHENRSKRFREILCTKTVRKKIIIIVKKKHYKNNKVFRWKRKTLIRKKKPNKNNKVFRWKRKTLIRKKKPYKNNKVFRWKRKTLKKILSKTFFGIKHTTFQNWEEYHRKNCVICTLSSCVIWCVVLIPVAFPLLLSRYLIEKCVWNEIKVSFSKHYDILSIFNWIFCKLEII